MDIDVALIMGATLAAIVINGLILNRLVRQVQNQCDDTRALAATNRNLEYRVDRLAMKDLRCRRAYVVSRDLTS